MSRGFHQHIIACILAIIVLAAVTACTAPSPTKPPPDTGIFDIDPVFREFYKLLGGKELLGPAISGLFDYENRRCQYTHNVLMCYDPLAKDIERFSLYPLGRLLALDAGEGVSEKLAASVYVDGIPIYDEFLELYEQLQGPVYTGKPLTAVRTNYLQNRIEQYFENVGFYRLLDEPAGEAHLLALGGYLCDLDCRYNPQNNPGAIIRTGGSEVEQPFLTSLMRMGGVSVFGQPLTLPFTAPDGNVEQVYENAVLYAPGGDLSSPRLRPVPQTIGIPSTAPVPNESKHGMVFYPIEGGLGYHVPEIFDRFIAQHGGREISGPPIQALEMIKDQYFRQCFQNYCLDYDHRAPEPLQVRMATLGPAYLEAMQIDPALIVRFVYSPETVVLKVSESHERLAPNEKQWIEIHVLRKLDESPIPEVEGFVRLRLPDGSEWVSRFPPTNAAGAARVEVPPMELPNSSVIGYEACLNVPSEERICVDGSYLIWDVGE